MKHITRWTLVATALVAAVPAQGQRPYAPEPIPPAPWTAPVPSAPAALWVVAAPSEWSLPIPAPTPVPLQAEVEPRITAPESWLPDDPGDSLYRAAREALNRRQFGHADTLFALIRARFPESGYAADSYYFQAFALQRMGGRERGEQALALLAEQRARHPRAATLKDAARLGLRIQGTLAQVGNARAVAAVDSAALLSCADDDQELRATALSALVSMDDARVVPILREILKSRDECSVQLRRQAAFMVGRVRGAEAIDIMLDVAQRNPDPDLEVRGRAISWLARMDAPEAAAALESILRTSSDLAERELVINEIGRQGTPRAASTLKELAKANDTPIDLRRMAISWLGRDAENGGTAFLREIYPSLGDATLREDVMGNVARSKAEEDRAWIRARALDATESLEARRSAVSWAARSGLTVAEMRKLYGEMADRDLRGELIVMISRRKEPEAIDAMLDIAATEKDKELRQSVIFLLGRSDDPRAVDYLLKVIKGEAR